MAARTEYINLFGVTAYWQNWTGTVFDPIEVFALLDSISLTVEKSSITHNSRQCGSVGVTDRTASSTTDVKGTAVSPEMSPKMIARAWEGKLNNNPVSEGTATENAVTIEQLDMATSIGLAHLTNVSVWDTAGGTGVEYAEGTDYHIDYRLGNITAVTGGAISVSDEVFVIADNAAYNDWHVAAFTGGAAKGKLTLIGCPQDINADPVTYVVELAELSLEGDFNIVSAEDFLTMTLAISALADSTITDPNKSRLLNFYGQDSVNPTGA